MDWAMKFQVRTMDGGQYAVDLDAWTCSCKKWDLCDIPCSHTVATIKKKDFNLINNVHGWYKEKNAYVKAYAPIIHPMSGFDTWR